MAVAAERRRRLDREPHLRAGGDDDRVGGAPRRLRHEDVATPPDRLDPLRPSRLVRNALAREQQADRSVLALDRVAPRRRRLDRVAGPPHGQVRDEPERRAVLDRLVGGSVLAEADRIVGQHEDPPEPHQGGHPDRVTRVVGEDEERSGVGDHPAVQGHPVHDRAHRELAHPEVEIVPVRRVAGDGPRPRPPGQVRPREVGRSADELREVGGEVLDRDLGRFAGGGGGPLTVNPGDRGRARARPAVGKGAAKTPVELLRELWPGRPIGVHAPAPLGLEPGAGGARIPPRAHRIRYLEGGMRPAHRLPRPRHLVRSERGAVGSRSARLGRSPPPDGGPAANEARPLAVAPGRLDRRLHRRPVVAVHAAHHLPAVCLEAGRGVVGEPALHAAVDGDARCRRRTR